MATSLIYIFSDGSWHLWLIKADGVLVYIKSNNEFIRVAKIVRKYGAYRRNGCFYKAHSGGVRMRSFTASDN